MTLLNLASITALAAKDLDHEESKDTPRSSKSSIVDSENEVIPAKLVMKTH